MAEAGHAEHVQGQLIRRFGHLIVLRHTDCLGEPTFDPFPGGSIKLLGEKPAKILDGVPSDQPRSIPFVIILTDTDTSGVRDIPVVARNHDGRMLCREVLRVEILPKLVASPATVLLGPKRVTATVVIVNREGKPCRIQGLRAPKGIHADHDGPKGIVKISAGKEPAPAFGHIAVDCEEGALSVPFAWVERSHR